MSLSLQPSSSRPPRAAAAGTSDYEVVVVGAGFAGIGMAAKLKAAGIARFVVLEQAASVGGTWRDNTYPGCACDIPSELYSFSFAPATSWSQTYPEQPEIERYLQRCLERFELGAHLCLNTRMRSARYDERKARWSVLVDDGRTFQAQTLILATGGLNRPFIPELPGAETFRGFQFHSSRWDHAVDLAGKRVAVIGTGASAIQIVPRLCHSVASLTLFQRTPAWIVSKREDGPLRAAGHATGWRARLRRWRTYWRQEVIGIGLTAYPSLMQRAEAMANAYRESVLPPGELRERLRPDYPMGCKRILISNDFYPSLLADNVELIGEAVTGLSAQAVHTAGGQSVAVDGVIYATGFRTHELFQDVEVTGLGGQTLRDAWSARPSAYLGMAVHGFPNLFLLVGPNTGLGHNSIVFMIEAQLHYVVQALKLLRARRLASLDVLAAVQQRFARRLDARLGRTIWASGCRSWYLDAKGRNSTLWPGLSVEYWLRTRRLARHHYRFVPAPLTDSES